MTKNISTKIIPSTRALLWVAGASLLAASAPQAWGVSLSPLTPTTGYLFSVGSGGSLTIDGLLPTIDAGGAYAGTSPTLSTLITSNSLTFTSGGINASNYSNYFIFTPPAQVSTTVLDPSTNSNVVFSVYQSSALSTAVGANFGATTVFVATAGAPPASYQDFGFGQVQSTGGALTVNVGDSTQNIVAAANTITLLVKTTALAQADGTGGVSSTVNWSSKNFVNFIVGPSLQPSQATGSGSGTRFAGTFVGFDGANHNVTDTTSLAAYNDLLLNQLATWLKPVASGGLGLTQTQVQAKYNSEFAKATITDSANYSYNQWSDGGTYNNGATTPSAYRAAISVTGANAVGTIDSTGAIAAWGAGFQGTGVVRATNGAKIINNGSISALSFFGEWEESADITDSTFINNGVVNANVLFNNDGTRVTNLTAANAGVTAGTFGVRSFGASTLTNTGVINQAPFGIGLWVNDASTSSNSGTINVTNGFHSDGSAYSNSFAAAVALGGAGSFTNSATGLIYVGRQAQASAGAAASDVVLTGGNYFGIENNGTGTVINNGTITIGALTDAAIAIAVTGQAGANGGITTNNGTINLNGGTGTAAPHTSVGLAAQDTGGNAGSAVTNNGIINVSGVNNIGIRVLATAAVNTAVSTTNSGAINVTGGIDPTTNIRNYGVWVESDGTASATSTIDSPITLGGRGAIGVFVRNASTGTASASVTQNASPIFQNTDQISYYLFGAGSSLNAAGATIADGGFARSTLFRVGDGASFNGTNGLGGVSLSLTATGNNSVAVRGSGVGTTLTTGNATFTVGNADATGALAGGTGLLIEGGATGNIAAGTTVILNASHVTGAIVDGNKTDLSGAVVGNFATTLNSSIAMVAGSATTTNVTGYVARNGGQITLSAASSLTIASANSIGVDVQSGGTLNNLSSSAIQVNGNIGVRVSGANTQIQQLGTVVINGGIAGVQLLNGAALTIAGSNNAITTNGAANAILLDTGVPITDPNFNPALGTPGKATSLTASNTTITANGTGAGIENKAEIGNVTLNNVTIKVGNGAAIRTATSFNTSTLANLLTVSGTGTGFAFQNFDGTNATGDLTMDSLYTINVLTGSVGGTGINAKTAGNVNTSGAINIQSATGGSAVVATSALNINNSGVLTSLSTSAPVIDGTGSAKSITNSGTITASSNSAVAIAGSSTNAMTVNLTGGAVKGVVNVGSGSAINILSWLGGTLDGEINLSNGAGNSALVAVVDLSATRHVLTGTGAGNTLEFSGTTGTAAKVGSFAADNLAQGTNIGSGWNVLGATHNGDLRIVSTLQLAGAASHILVASGATLRVGGAGITAGSISNHDVVTSDANGAGTLVFDDVLTQNYTGVISGSGNFIREVGGFTTFTNANTYTGTTSIKTGSTLQLGTGGTSGGIAAVSAIQDDGALIINRSDTRASGTSVVLNGVIGGLGSFEQKGTGDTELTGTNSYLGTTTVSAGTLRINGDQSLATGATSVLSGATLGGAGKIGGNVNVNSGATLAPGNSPGTLSIAGNLILNTGSIQNWELGQAFTPGGALNDLVNVGGNLTLAGTLNVALSSSGTFGPGIYRIYNYAGTLTGSNTDLTLGSLPAGTTNTYVQTSVNHQVNLANTTGVTLRFWDGAGGTDGALKNNNSINNGDGKWQLSANDNWTSIDGAINAPYSNNSLAVFEAGGGGNVTVDNSNGQVLLTGTQFAENGYVIQGDKLLTTGAPTQIQVGDGTSSGAAYTATFNNVIDGASGIEKTDAGTLILNGVNTYAGGTTVSGGNLQVSADNNLGQAGTGLTLNGGALKYGAAFTLLRQITLGSNGGWIDTNGFDAPISTAIVGAGALTKLGAGTLTLTADNTYAGGTTISAGTLQLGNGSTTGRVLGNITDNSVLTINHSDSVTLSGVISGSGTLNQSGSGTTVLTGNNTFAGATNVYSGTLQLGNGGIGSNILGNTSNININSGATLQLNFASGSATNTAVSAIAGNLNNGGKVYFYHLGTTFQVNGNYDGNGGKLYLETNLGGDNSATDKLHVLGATSGTTLVFIRKATTGSNLGGQTVSGIQVIQVDGTGSTGNFTLGAPVQAGAFEYHLTKGSDILGNSSSDSWYLTSSKPEPINPIYRPAIPGYVLAQEANFELGAALIADLHKRMGEQHHGLNGNDAQNNKQTPSSIESENQGQVWGRIGGAQTSLQGERVFAYKQTYSFVQAGMDLYQDDVEKTVNHSIYNTRGEELKDRGGVLLGYANGHGDFEQSARASEGLNPSTGNLKSDYYSLGGYYTHYNDNGSYLDMVGSAMMVNNQFNDSYGGNASQQGVGYVGSVELGKAYAIIHQWSLEPEAQLAYQHISYRGFQDQSGSIAAFSADSLRARAGARFGWNGGKGSTLYFTANLYKELLNPQSVDVGTTQVSEQINHDFWFEVGVGGQVHMAENIYLYGNANYEHNLGNYRREGVSGSVGVRVVW